MNIKATEECTVTEKAPEKSVSYSRLLKALSATFHSCFCPYKSQVLVNTDMKIAIV